MRDCRLSPTEQGHVLTLYSSAVCTSSPLSERPVPDSQWPVFLQSFISVIWGLFTSLLALINSLVMLFIAPQFLHSSGSLSLLVYLDPCLSLLAVITLLAATLPQVLVLLSIFHTKTQFILITNICLFSLVPLCRCTGMGGCCCKPRLHTCLCPILDEGLRACPECRLCTTSMSGS